MKPLEYVTREAFEPFGSVIEFPKGTEEKFFVVDTEEKEPWRVAVFRYSNRSVQRFERHPYSKESFEPLQGLTVLLVSEYASPQDYHAFILDKPVCMKKGIWHQVLSLTEEAQVKITENLEVTSEFYDQEKQIGIMAEELSDMI